MIPLWIDKSFGVWNRSPEIKYRKFRETFFKRLKSDAHRWSELIVNDIRSRRIDDIDKLNAEYLLNEARGDPLLILNFCGVPPQSIVFKVCHYREQADRIERFNQQQLAAQSIDNAVNALKAAAIELGRYKSFLEKIDYELGKLQLQNQRAAAILQSFRLDRGRHANPTYAQLVQSIYHWCDFELRNRRGGNPKHVTGESYTLDIDREHALDTGEITSLPAITAICIAAFPEAFETRKNPVRNVYLMLNRTMSKRDRAVSMMLTP